MNQKREAYASLYTAYDGVDEVLESMEAWFVESDSEFRWTTSALATEEFLTSRNVLYAVSGLPVTSELLHLYDVFLSNTRASTFVVADICRILGSIYSNTPIELIEDLHMLVLKAVDKPGFSTYYLSPTSFKPPDYYQEITLNAKISMLRNRYHQLGKTTSIERLVTEMLSLVIDPASYDDNDLVFNLCCDSFLFSPDEMSTFLDNLAKNSVFALDYVSREELSRSIFCVLAENATING